MALEPAQELELLRLRKKKAMSAQAPAAYEGDAAQAGGRSLLGGLAKSTTHLMGKFGLDKAGMYLDQGIPGVPNRSQEEQAALRSSDAGSAEGIRSVINEGMAPARRAFPKSVGAGNIAGEVLPYLSLGGVTNAGVRAGVGATALKAFPKVSKALASIAEGAAVGAGMSEEGETLKGAGTGAAFGAIAPGLGAAARGAGKTISGLGSFMGNKLRPSAVALADSNSSLAGHIPLSQSLQDGPLRMLYGQMLSVIPKTGDAIRGQYDDALNLFRHEVLDKVTPPPAIMARLSGGKDLLKGLNVKDKATAISKMWDATWKPFHKLEINTSKAWMPQSKFVDDIANKSKVAEFWKKGFMNGRDFTTLRTEISKRISFLAKHPNQGNRLGTKYEMDELIKWDKSVAGYTDEAGKFIPGVLRKQFKPGTQLGQVVDDWESSRQAFGDWTKVKSLYDKTGAREGFTPQQLHAHLDPKAAEIGSELAAYASNASDALAPFAGNPNVYATLAAASIIGVPAASIGIKGAIGGAMTLGLTRLLAVPGIQKAIANNPGVTKTVAEAVASKVSQGAKFELVARILADAGILSAVQEDK